MQFFTPPVSYMNVSSALDEGATPPTHTSQGGVTEIGNHLKVKGDYIWLLSADLSLYTQATITGTPTAAETPGVRFTLNSVNYDSTYTVQPGDTNDDVALGIATAMAANTSLVAALAAVLDLQGYGMGNPLQGGAAAQTFGNAVVFSSPYVAGTTASALSSANTTVTIVGAEAGSGTPRMDGGPTPIIGRVYPNGYSLAANDLGPYVEMQTWVDGDRSQVGYWKTRYTAATSIETLFGTMQSGTAADRLGIGLGIYAKGAGELGDKGAATMSAATMYATTYTNTAGVDLTITAPTGQTGVLKVGSSSIVSWNGGPAFYPVGNGNTQNGTTTNRWSTVNSVLGNFTGLVTALSGTAVGAGANTQAWIKASSTSNLGVYYGTGDPTFSAAKGSTYSKTDATTTTTRFWINTDGSTTWTAFTSAA